MAKQKVTVADQPYLENYPVLRDWLNANNASCVWQVRTGKDPLDNMVEAWIVNARIVIVVIYARQRGWDIFTSTDSNKVGDALSDAARRIGLATKYTADGEQVPA